MKQANDDHPKPLVRASDIGAWAFCQRAWWLARVQGAEHRNPAVLRRGDEMHAVHGRTVSQAAWLQRAALVLMAVAVLLLIIAAGTALF